MLPQQPNPHTHIHTYIHTQVLSQLLPPSLICFLNNHPPEAFSTMFMSDSDTPEAIWHARMRDHLASVLRHHICNFAYTLKEDFLRVYEYAPLLSSVKYAELEQELWCHSFFLRNLCNTAKFSNWAISEPFLLLKSCIERCAASVCVCVCIHTYIHPHIYMYVCMCVYITSKFSSWAISEPFLLLKSCIERCVTLCVCVCLCIYMFVYVYIYIYIYIFVCVYMYVCLHTHTHTHTDIYIYIYIYIYM